MSMYKFGSGDVARRTSMPIGGLYAHAHVQEFMDGTRNHDSVLYNDWRRAVEHSTTPGWIFRTIRLVWLGYGMRGSSSPTAWT